MVNVKSTCEVLLEQILQPKEHHLTEWGTLLAAAFKVGVDVADVRRVLLVVSDLAETTTERGCLARGHCDGFDCMKCASQTTMD